MSVVPLLQDQLTVGVLHCRYSTNPLLPMTRTSEGSASLLEKNSYRSSSVASPIPPTNTVWVARREVDRNTK